MTRHPIDSPHETTPLDPALLETALSLTEHRERVLEALRAGDWRWVDELPEVELSGSVDGWKGAA